jgi:hypothetical protein
MEISYQEILPSQKFFFDNQAKVLDVY